MVNKTATNAGDDNSNNSSSSNPNNGHGAMVVASDSAEPSTSTVTVIHEDSSSGSQYLKLGGHLGEVFMCLWSPASNQLSSGSADGTCRLW
jgi:WD40 repeat protein